jgi:hypothetical protein
MAIICLSIRVIWIALHCIAADSEATQCRCRLLPLLVA